jgi:GntR family transcriptional regulator
MDLNEEFKQKFEMSHLELHRDSPVPIYYQLSLFFRKLIQDECFRAGTRFPSEEVIASHFNVGRPTASKAVQILLNEGWLTRDKQDKRSGTYVKEKPYIGLGFMTEGMSFADQFSTHVPLRSRIIWTRILPATSRVANSLNLQEGEPVFHIRRLRFAYDQPVLVCDSKLSAARFPKITERDFVEDSLYKTLAEHYNCPIVRSDREAMAVEVIDPEIVTLLGVQPLSSILFMTGVSYTLDDDPIDFLETYIAPGVSLKSRVYKKS